LNDRSLVEQAWPGVQHALAKLEATDVDGDGLPDHDGRADQTFDTWPMNGPSAFAGGLWLATRGAAIEMAEDMGDAAAAARYQALRLRGQGSYLERLWN